MKERRKFLYFTASCLLFFTFIALLLVNNISSKKHDVVADGESAEISVLSYTGLSLQEDRAEYTVSVDGADTYESLYFIGTVEMGGQEKEILVSISYGTATFIFEYPVFDEYFVLNENTLFVSATGDGISISFTQSYLMSFVLESITPVSVLYNPSLLSWNETTLTASCGGAIFSTNEPSVGVLCTENAQISATLTFDPKTSTFTLSSAHLPDCFTILENTLFVSSTAAYRFDVEYLFKRADESISPTQITVSIFDGNEIVYQYQTRIGETLTLPDCEILTGAGLRLGLSDGQKLYPFESEYLAEKTVNLYAQYLPLKTQDAACARLLAPYGVRFTTTLPASAYESLLKLNGVELSFGGEISVYGSNKKLEIATDPVSFYQNGENTCYHTAVVGIKPQNLALVYQCTPTLSLVYSNGQRKNFVGESTKEGRSYAQVLKNAYDELEVYDEETQKVIVLEYEKVLSSKEIKPVLLVYVNGEISQILKTEISELYASLSIKIGESLDLTAFFQDNAPDGFTIDENKSRLTGELSESGLIIEVYYVG